jgi:hypothetical protein
MQNKYVKPFAICRIVTCSDFGYSEYVWTPHFADDIQITVKLEVQKYVLVLYKIHNSVLTCT